MMDHTYHKTLENAAVVQLTAVLSAETVPWDSIGISSKNIILNAGQYSEEHVLKCTFKACDPEETGQVSVFRIIEYLQEMTGQSYEDWRLQSLYKKLDPEERGLTVDFSTFYAVMKDWIADCRQEGSQQTLEQAKVLANELEDLKVFSKSMEEENIKLHTQARQLEKEQQLLSVQVDNLQDENKKLLLEKESSKCKIKELFTEKAKMKFQLCEYENLTSCKDAALNECLYLQKTKQAEELTITLDEYRMMVKELKLEVSRLQEHLCQSYQDLKRPPTNSLQNINGPIQAPARPLYMEIEESRRQEISKERGLPSPLCGMLHSLVMHPVAEGSISSLPEELEHSKKGSDDTKALLPTSHSLSQLSLVTDGRLILKNQEHKQHQNHLPSEKGSMEESKQSLTGNSKTLELTLKNSDVWTNSSNIESQMVCFTFQEIMVFSSAELSSEEALQEHSFIPNDGELIPIVWKKTNSCSFEILLQRLFDVPLGYLLLHILQKLVLLGLLLVCVSLIAVFCLVILYNQYSVWIEPKGNFWPFLQLQYRHPPPI
ncbi:protein KASH5 isoform X7 [Python bivittatus]|uniref:Protein KASH5 isoform X7 n=1 Tax=Python bivittatus TaxID=176946 RepID=A0A9F5J0A4_PYTBI|nr:protein KASH5 isoform X7 [Python bivittatus]